MPRVVDSARHVRPAGRRRNSQRHRARLHPRRGRRLRPADHPRLDGGVPRSRRGAARGQGIRRPGRRHHQFPIRHMIRTIAVCEAQVPFVHGGAELHVRGLVTRAAAPRLPRRTRVGAVQVVPEGRAAHARRRLAHDRSERSQRRTHRSRHRHEVPDLLRPAPEQDHLAVPPVPRDLRPLRHRRTASSPTPSATCGCATG